MDAGSAEREDVVVRQYRYLLRTAPADALEVAHVEALPQLRWRERGLVLAAVQDGLVAGLRLDRDQVRALAHLVTLGERRSPGAFLAAVDPVTLRHLADLVVVAEASFGLFGGYATWDGSDPVAPEEPWTDSGFAERWRTPLTVRVVYLDYTGGPSTPDSFGRGR
ncbi:hypothetical protein [Pedococcus ginsenosidimutans]|uniref:hypothetical protein n=1 Tax=Pedococcus ginsenosidimutans TaxID=490570 RepID=UPI0031EF1869